MTDRLPLRLAAGSGPTFGVDDLSCAAATSFGFWADEGLDVSWMPVHGGVAAIEAVLNGAVDVSYGGLGPLLRSRAAGNPVRVVVSMARGLAQSLVTQRRIRSESALRGVSWALDGMNALSHHMARLTVRALGIDEAEIDWRVVGPPPERIERLVAGSIDVSLIRVEEAVSLTRAHGDRLHTLLGPDRLDRLVPVQPHGVLGTTEAFERARPEALARLTRGMIRAARALNDDFDAFRAACETHVKMRVSEDELRAIWRHERDTGGFAVNGEMSDSHWTRQRDLCGALYPETAGIDLDAVLARSFAADALRALGRIDGGFDRT